MYIIQNVSYYRRRDCLVGLGYTRSSTVITVLSCEVKMSTKVILLVTTLILEVVLPVSLAIKRRTALVTDVLVDREIAYTPCISVKALPFGREVYSGVVHN